MVLGTLWISFSILVIYFIKYLFYSLGSIVYVISAPMSPIFGFLVDKTGKNIIWVLCAVVTTLASHVLLAFTLWNPWIAMVMSLLTPGGLSPGFKEGSVK